ncbi:MAG: DUF5717 family protein [Defluviitaleaceae bacterium]|nr:DUF5717 family protein [Defluviitaleaceae bacterium]
MANRAIGKILRFERIYNRRKDAKSTLAMALTYYMGYGISGQKDLLHKANFVLQTADFSADLGLDFARCFIASEMENFDLLEELLASMKSRRNAMKSHEPAYYAHYLYFTCFHALAKGKERAATKQYRALSDYHQQLGVDDARLLLANLNLIMGEHETAFRYLHKAYKNGENSPLFFVCLARAFGEAKPSNAEAELLLPLILWALNSGCFIDNIIIKNEMLAESLLRRRPKVAEALHGYHPANWTLHIIVTARMIDNDLSDTAFTYYREAEARQLHFPQLYDFLLRSAHRNENEEISGYALAQYIKQETEIPDDIRPFVYHLVVQGVLAGRHDEIMEQIGGDIWAFACRSLEQHLYGKYYYSLYKFMVDARIAGVRLPVERKYISLAEEIIKSLLFAYDVVVDDPRAKKILVQEDFKRQEELHALKDGRVRVNLWSPNVRITCFDESLRNIIDGKHSLTKLVQNAGFEMYQWFYKQHHQPLEMLIFLADHHIKAEQLTLEATTIFDKVVKSAGSGVDRGFLRMINATLGGHYAKEGDFVRAVEYFKGLDNNSVNRKYLEQMLTAYLHTDNHDLAANLLAGWGEDIPDKTLFTALKRISPHIDKITNKKGVASTSADMLIRGWHDEMLMGMVLNHYVAPLPAWIELAKTLSNLDVFEVELFVKILDTAMLTRDCSKGVQSVFVELAKQAPKNELLQDFVMYICYEIVTGGLIPESTTIQVMEGFAGDDSPAMLLFALAHIYIRGGINRPKSKEVLVSAITLAGEANIIFPIFKEIKDKQIISAYIDRNTTFMHRSRGEHAVTLNYRTAGDGEFTQTPMTYVAFGIWLAHAPHFYGEEIEYFFAETRGSGSVKTTSKTIANNTPHLLEKAGDLFYTINSALVYEQMFKYEKVEEIVTARLAEKPAIRAKIM